jgi:hypothetical protein
MAVTMNPKMRSGLALALLLSYSACEGSMTPNNVEGGSTIGGSTDSSAGNSDADVGTVDSGVDSTAEKADSSLRPDASEGSAVVSGTIEGHPLSARGALGLFYKPPIPPQVHVVIPVSYNLTCALLQSPSEYTTPLLFANQAGLDLSLPSVVTPAGPPLTPGTYSVVADGGTASMTAGGTYLALDADCGSPNTVSASSGNVTISMVNTTTISGTFDLTFSDGDHLMGQFSATNCVLTFVMPIQSPMPVCVP